MSVQQVLVTPTYLEDIADAIRDANGGSATYKPSQMAAAVNALKKTLIAKSITANGNYAASSDSADGFSSVSVDVPNTYAVGDEGKVVSSGALVAQTARASQITENGTYDTTTNNSVQVNVSGGGSSPVIEALENRLLTYYSALTVIGTNYPSNLSQNVLTFMNTYAKDKYGTKRDGTSFGTTVEVTTAVSQESVEAFKARFATLTQAEYSGYVTDAMISALSLVELGRNTASGSSIDLSDSIENYSAVVMQGIYGGTQYTSTYNTTMMYINPQLNTSYWAGVKDRNNAYDRYVSFTSNVMAALSGGRSSRGIIIWGMP